MVKTIAIAGCIGRIGTTTQAVQAVLTLKQGGLKACYLEMNRTRYLDQLLTLYGAAEDEGSFIKYSGIHMYKGGYAKTAAKKGWDYIVRDYGQANIDSFEKTSFAEQPVKVITCGSKPNEIFAAQELLSDPTYEDAYFVFSFVPEEERLSIISLMGRRSGKTFFAGTAMDPYILIPDSVRTYHKILGME